MLATLLGRVKSTRLSPELCKISFVADGDRLKNFYPKSGFFNGFTLQGCVRLAVKLDFLVGLLYKAARTTGVGRRRTRRPS